MPEEINHARRFLLSTFFAGSAITIAATDLGIIGPADARSSKDDQAGATQIQLPTQTQRKDRRMEHPTLYRTMQIDGLSIFYREAGPKDAPTLLLLHGLPSSSRMFEPLFARLSDSFHLVAPDYPGFGHSDWPDPKKFAYTFDHIAEIMDHFTSGEPLLIGEEVEVGHADDVYEGEAAQVVAEIKELIDTRIRPAVAQDGGDILFARFEPDTGVVFLNMRGACSGCPSSAATLKAGVENLLRHYVPEVTRVEQTL